VNNTGTKEDSIMK